MTKKHFIIAANEFGRLLRDENDADKIKAIYQAIDIFCLVAGRVNFNFSRSVFMSWISDIEDGIRDFNGRKTDAVIMSE